MFKRLCVVLLLLIAGLDAKQKICLNMIVKDESKVITRCLDSVKPLIDYWVIVDTGSTDGTQEIIRKHMKGIPGELHERPWKNFGESRSEAYDLARGKGDYILFMDADDTLEYKRGFKFPELKHEIYDMWRGSKEFSYLKPQLVKGDLPWKWVGVTHEYLGGDFPHVTDVLKDIRYVSGDGGARSSDPKKFLKNVQLLEDGLKKEPWNSRYAFYLAESYRDAGEKGKALECYQKRVNMGGWEEEIFWSKLQIAHLMRDIGLSPHLAIEAYKQAHAYRPHRMEPIYYLVQLYCDQGDYKSAYEYLRLCDFIPRPEQRDALFNENWIEDYGLLFQKSICSYYVGNYQESIDLCDKLLKISNLPAELRKQAKANRVFPVEKLREKKTAKAE
ncbi:MAG: glycosyltransferase [Chlamydiales bacterium]|nr:glycosyltransferase [Chlamydiales bacterium]